MENVKELETLLEFYASNGVDCALDETPHDRFSEMEAARAERMNRATSQAPNASVQTMPQDQKNQHLQGTKPHQPIVAPPAIQTVPDAVVLGNAREVAGKADSLEALRAILETFDGCNLKRTAKNLVFGDGNPNARVMFVGEAPGRDEDINGIPFVGRAGELLNKMMAAIDLNREEDVYIANIVPWRPPGSRNPTLQEAELCRPFIERQIELINPDILVPLGAATARQLLNTTDGIMKLRGRIKPYGLKNREIIAIPTLHPDYILSQPSQKRRAWQDLLTIKKQLHEQSSKKSTHTEPRSE
ncbi:MAG: uracil-DNA glycosylase [Hyphomicrobiales bacterium]